MAGELATVDTGNGGGQLSVAQVVGRMGTITELMKAAMVQGVDYGVIPGTNSKPTLHKPGAEKLCVMFRLDPQYQTTKTFHDDGHLTVECYCTIQHADARTRLGSASAICSTRESKYAYRKGERQCPSCGKGAIIKGKVEFGGGWLCWKKKDGCGRQFPDGAKEIESQAVGRVANADLPDSYHTVLRIAEKRALVAAVRQVTGASAIFDEESADHGPAEADPDPQHASPTRGNGMPKRQESAPPRYATAEQHAEIARLLNDTGADPKKYVALFRQRRGHHPNEMTPDEAAEEIQLLAIELRDQGGGTAA